MCICILGISVDFCVILCVVVLCWPVCLKCLSHYLTPVCPPFPQLVGVEARLGELEASHKELTDHKYRSQAAIRELKAKLKSTEEVSFMIHVYTCAVRCLSSSVGRTPPWIVHFKSCPK